MTTDTTVATTIYRQLGGGRFAAMTGAKNFIASADNMLSFLLPARMAKNGAHRVTIELTPADLYTVRFWRARWRQGRFTITLLSQHDDISNDSLVSLFELETGLATSLGRMRA